MYAIEFSKDVEKDLAKIPKIHVNKILEKISKLTHNPRPPGVKALQGNLKGLYRIRSGNYRVVYQTPELTSLLQLQAVMRLPSRPPHMNRGFIIKLIWVWPK